jgi:hypothetical protein
MRPGLQTMLMLSFEQKTAAQFGEVLRGGPRCDSIAAAGAVVSILTQLTATARGDELLGPRRANNFARRRGERGRAAGRLANITGMPRSLISSAMLGKSPSRANLLDGSPPGPRQLIGARPGCAFWMDQRATAGAAGAL